jgi:pyruvate dehydrogenase (quinone)
MVGTRPAQNALKSCDAILIVGSSSPYIEALPAPGQAAGVQIDDRAERIGLRYPVEVGLCGDAKLTSGAARAAAPDAHRPLVPRAGAGRDARLALAAGAARRTGRGADQAGCGFLHLGRAMADRAILCGDSGTVTTWAARTELRRGQMFSFSGTMCSMMAALPYAIGAQAA